MALFPCLLLLVYSAGSFAEEPCDSNTYTLLEDSHRSSLYVLGDTEQAICDMDKSSGWYRFNSSAGDTIPNSCVERNHCGTGVPIWMEGKLPAVGEGIDGIVDRKACANFGVRADCCDRHLTIKVKNCDGYFVYYLYPAPTCPIAYCAGNKESCPFGQWSPNGLQPNCIDTYPRISNVTMNGPILKESPPSFVFECVLDFAQQDPNQTFEVEWTADGAHIGRENMADPQRISTLDGASLTKEHMGTAIGCKIRSITKGPNVYSPWIYSNVYRAEIQVEPLHVVISENGTDQNVTLTSTIPVVCATTNVQSCVVSIPLDFNGHKDDALLTTPCVYKLKSSDWNDTTSTVSTSVTLVASSDKLPDSKKHMVLSFRQLFELGDPYKAIFDNYTLPSVQVDIEDSSVYQCDMVSDPHITGFKGNYFHLFTVGVYTMYYFKGTDTNENFEFQIQTFSCNGGIASCICGVAIRENEDVIRTSFCDELRATPTISVPRTLREGTNVQASSDGRSLVVYFPSGREVSVLTTTSVWGGVSTNYNNVKLVIPAADLKGTYGGICGTLDKLISNDQYIHKDGTWERACEGHSRCIPVRYEESWSVQYTDSWFVQPPPAPNGNLDYAFCQCDPSDNNPKRVNCSIAADKSDHIIRCPDCTKINPEPPWEARGLFGDDYDEPVPQADTPTEITRNWNIDFPTPSGITEQQARDRCLQKMQSSQLWSKCNQTASIVDVNMENCVTDILFTDSFSMAESALVAFTSQCQSELSLDPRNYISTPDGESIMKPELTTDICSTFCLQNGNCANGTCVCNDGFVGDNCQLDAKKGPQLLRIRGSEYCDTNERPCRKIFFDAENFQRGHGFICKSQEIMEDGQPSTDPYFEDAIFINSIRLACIVPDARTKTDKWLKTFRVSATFDGNSYGNSMDVNVYDSTCQTCNNVTGCTRKPNTCLIDDLCYLDGDWKPGYNTRRCMVSHSNDSWSRVSPCTGEVVAPDWTLDKCLINNVCYDDGVYKASDLTRRCMLSLSNHSWTPVSPCTGDVVGPDWTVFQRRYTGSEDFYRDWNEYVAGFGHNNGEFWMGLEPLHQLMSSGSYELRVDLKDWNNVTASASYSNFSIGGAADNYMMYYNQFIGGDAGDSLSKHQHMPFSTKDADHDLAFTGSCADWYHGGWWYNACQDANLNGRYVIQNVNNASDGIEWKTFRGQGRSMKCTEMRVRPTSTGTSGNLLG